MGEKILGVYHPAQTRQRALGMISKCPRRIAAWFSGVSPTESSAQSQTMDSRCPASWRSWYSPSPPQHVQADEATS